MRNGIAQKLIRTYVVIIATTVISGAFCLYVLGVNLRTNSQIRYVTLPSLEHLNDMGIMLQEIKKLADTRVYIANYKDKNRLDQILNHDYAKLDNRLQADAKGWENKSELSLLRELRSGNQEIVGLVSVITRLLGSTESYADDIKTDSAAALNSLVGKRIKGQSKLLTELITKKEDNFVRQQILVSSLLNSLYIIISLTIVIVLVVSYISSVYSKKNVVDPLLKLNETILKMAVGEVVPIQEEERRDEIGEMHRAVRKMIEGVIQKINFAEQIGKEKYDAAFTLLSEKDKLGLALLTMRDDLKQSNATLLEQEKQKS